MDACAAPGSKTVQLIELLHDEESSQVPGNELDILFQITIHWSIQNNVNQL